MKRHLPLYINLRVGTFHREDALQRCLEHPRQGFTGSLFSHFDGLKRCHTPSSPIQRSLGTRYCFCRNRIGQGFFLLHQISPFFVFPSAYVICFSCYSDTKYVVTRSTQFKLWALQSIRQHVRSVSGNTADRPKLRKGHSLCVWLLWYWTTVVRLPQSAREGEQLR